MTRSPSPKTIAEAIDALRDIASALESEAVSCFPTGSEAPFLDRRPAWLEERAYRRALQEIPTFKVGRRVLVRPADLRAWVEAHPVVPASKGDPDTYDEFKAALRKRGKKK